MTDLGSLSPEEIAAVDDSTDLLEFWFAWFNAVAEGKPPKVLTPLPLKVRARLKFGKVMTWVGIWLMDHGMLRVTVVLWRGLGMM